MNKEYKITDYLRLVIDYLITKVRFKKARLVRRPFYLRGKKGFSYLSGFTTGHGCRIGTSNKKGNLLIGHNARLGDYVHINADNKVVIGDNVLVASKVFITDSSHGVYKGKRQTPPYIPPSERELFLGEVIIGDNVWIGENVVILPGTTIGDGCIIGANSVLVGGAYDNNSIIVGSPGRVIKRFDENCNQWKAVENK